MRNQLLRQLDKLPRYKRGERPQFDSQLTEYGIEQEDFERDKKLKARFYDENGQLMTFDEQNNVIPVLPDGKEVFNEKYKNVTVEGYTVSSGSALNYKGQIASSQVSADNQTAENERKYNEKKNQLQSGIVGLETKISGIRTDLAKFDGKAEADLTTEEYNRKQRLTDDLRTSQSELAEKQRELKNLPPPVVVQSRQDNSGGKFTEAQARQHYEGTGKYTRQQIDELIRQGRSRGMIY